MKQFNAREIPIIDWILLRDHLSLPMAQHLSGAPEPMIHELCHVYDCVGKKAFKFVGDQKEVNDVIKAKYGDRTKESDIAEIKVSAMTLLVLEPFGQSDLVEIINSMYMNIKSEGYKKDQKPLLSFFDFIKDETVIYKSFEIKNFILTFEMD